MESITGHTCEKCGALTTAVYNMDDESAYKCVPCNHWTVYSWDDVG